MITLVPDTRPDSEVCCVGATYTQPDARSILLEGCPPCTQGVTEGWFVKVDGSDPVEITHFQQTGLITVKEDIPALAELCFIRPDLCQARKVYVTGGTVETTEPPPPALLDTDEWLFSIPDDTYTVADIVAYASASGGYTGGKTNVYKITIQAKSGATLTINGETLLSHTAEANKNSDGSAFNSVDEFTTIVAGGGALVNLVLF